jgi:hypothetical protein
VLSKAVIPVRLGKSGDLASGPADPALLLSMTPDGQGEVGVILRDGTYSPRDSLDMVAGGKNCLLMPSRLAEGGEDFDWVKFKVMTRSD